MKKILFIANIDGHILAFHLPYLKWFKEQGWETFVASNPGDDKIPIPNCDHKYDVSIMRNIFNMKNLSAFKGLKKIIAENNFDIIHCHTAMGGSIGRLAAKRAGKKGAKILYTAHGFYFYEGGPLKRWLLHYFTEKYLSHYTDAIITINSYDYELAKTKFKAGKVFLCRGMGYDNNKFFTSSSADKRKYREEYGYEKNQILLFYAAELNENKNQKLLIEATAKLAEKYKNIKLLLAGEGPMEYAYKKFAGDKGIADNVDFLGSRNDVNKLCTISDIYTASSINDGQGINILEAMASGLPVIATKNKGHSDLIEDGKNGFLVSIKDSDDITKKISELIENHELKNALSISGIKTAEKYHRDDTCKDIIGIYKKFI
ncbi:MAG: glycosyltransferase family 4 protein [Clostridiales Family XIII bacterium]|jgi:glycosyltransferase EpsD|nr:glycosyltransferase family 4 protein [Clostridiales Family XIII bacterium]